MKLKPLLPEPGPVLHYIALLPKAQHVAAMQVANQVLNSPDGAKLLELLERSIEDWPFAEAMNERALMVNAANRMLLRDLQRLARGDNAYFTARDK